MENILDKDLRGGITSITVVDADAGLGVVFSSEGVSVTLPSDTALSVKPVEDSAEWSEQLTLVDGTKRVSHRLKFRLLANHPIVALLRNAKSGVVAVVEMRGGVRLLAGCSSHFGLERPLRVESLGVTSGRTRIDTPCCEVSLMSIDDAFAATLQN